MGMVEPDYQYSKLGPPYRTQVMQLLFSIDMFLNRGMKLDRALDKRDSNPFNILT